MGSLLVVLAVALFIASLLVLVVALKRPKTAAPPGSRQDPLSFNAMPQFGPRQLGPGAIVSYGGVDYVVRGSVTYREGPFVWWEHLLEEATSRRGSASKTTTDASSWPCG